MRLAPLALVLAVAGCDHGTPSPDPAKPAVSTTPTQRAAAPAELDARFVAAIRNGAAYAAWGRVDEAPRVAPAPCAMVGGGGEAGKASRVRLSAAGDGPHGEKLYYLWANDRRAYLANGATTAGFTIVKESFHAERAHAPATEAAGVIEGTPQPIKTLTVEGRTLEVGTPAGLFVMTKVGAADTSGTDAGWIYGTIATDGTVTSAGRVAACMKCHEDATHERLFGLAAN